MHVSNVFSICLLIRFECAGWEAIGKQLGSNEWQICREVGGVDMDKLRYTFSCSGSGRPYCREGSTKFRTKDNACVVLCGSRVIYANEEERHSKRKHDFATPVHALCAYNLHNTNQEAQMFNSDIAPANHHENHIYEAFYQSGFTEAAVMANDGRGNLDDCITLAYMKEGQPPVILKKFPRFNSPCNLYGITARHIFKHPFSKGKLMGLAAYGQDNGYTYISFDENEKSISVERDLVREHIAQCMSEAAMNGVAMSESLRENSDAIPDDIQGTIPDTLSDTTPDVMRARDIAYTVQKNFEDTMVSVVKHFAELLHEAGIHTENLCMSGGGVLNCPANSRIVDLGLFKNYWASPQPSDGCAESVGRVLRNMEACGEKLHSHRLKSSYLGCTYSTNELVAGKHYLENPIASICEYLKLGYVIAWYQDGAEYGPRALGHRSFLADPSRGGMLDALNIIKGREMWRPLAPVVPEELFNHVFSVQNTDMCEFMLRTLHVRGAWASKMQAVCHADGTTRPQLLKRSVNPELYDLIMAYFAETGVPCLVNTSLNINGFPIVETPRDLCDLAEEVSFIEKRVPPLKTIFIERGVAYEVGNE